ncbi:YjcZ family sporulation protein [Marinicrinis lubricantis]|uniref:YjcZ family sporulation protein n=1 Tax=Marinicrinis lubricantis TaxID=2086470 RepID=A0ABW1IL36_9BACL
MGIAAGCGTGSGFYATSFVLVLFILLVIILGAGFIL